MRDNGPFNRVLVITFAFVLLAACSPVGTIEGLADADRCHEPTEETLNEVFDAMVDDGIPEENLRGFLLSAAYEEHPAAWNWVFCLSYYGWECEGGTGLGTLFPTPPTTCVSPQRTGEVMQHVLSNPYLD